LAGIELLPGMRIERGRGRAPGGLCLGCEGAIARAGAPNRNEAASAAEFLYVK
jgi:hypothetical protein